MPRPSIDQQVTFLYTDDLKNTSAFYRDVLELEFALDQGSCHIFKLSPTSFLGVCHLQDRPTSPVGLTISLVSGDVDGFHKHLIDKGVAFERAPEFSERFQVYSCLFLDPNGYRIEIQEFRDDNWKN